MYEARIWYYNLQGKNVRQSTCLVSHTQSPAIVLPHSLHALPGVYPSVLYVVGLLFGITRTGSAGRETSR